MNLAAISLSTTSAKEDRPNPKLVSAAHEFEASLMKEFLEPLQQDSLFSEDAGTRDGDSGGSAGALMSFGAEAMAKAISEHGGFGIATRILDHFNSAGKSTEENAAAGKIHF